MWGRSLRVPAFCFSPARLTCSVSDVATPKGFVSTFASAVQPEEQNWCAAATQPHQTGLHPRGHITPTARGPCRTKGSATKGSDPFPRRS